MSTTATEVARPKWTVKRVDTFPEKWEYTPENFKREDESSDVNFYSSSRFVTHIDNNAIEKLTQYYASLIQSPCSILDLCGSWLSHLPLPLPSNTHVYGIGLNQDELERNPAYSDWKVFDLNASKEQKWTWLDDERFDLVICTVSIDYLIYPIEVLRECRRVLKKDGSIHLTISNRCFPTKAIALWLQLNEAGRVELVSNYLHFAGFSDIEVVEVATPRVGWEGDWGIDDPLWVVRGRKS